MPIQRTFAAGEIGPTLYGGVDFPRYMAGLATCRNFLVRREGGVANRPGTEFIAEVKDSAAYTILLKFIFSNSENYVIEAGNHYFRFYRNGARVTVGTPAAWSSLTAYVVGDVVSLTGTNYYCILATTNNTPPNATYWYPLSSNILEVPTPWATADLAALQWDQSGDIVWLAHPGYPPYELRRYPTRWTLAPSTFAPEIAAPASLAASAGTAGALEHSYVVTAIADETYEESLPSAPDSVSCAEPTMAAPNPLAWTAVPGAVQYNVYRDSKGNGVYYFLGIADSNSFNDPGLTEDESLTPPVAQNVFNAAGDYPAAVAFYQQRLMFGGSTNEPEKVRASKTGYFRNFTLSSPIQEDDPVAFTIAGRPIGTVRHLREAGHALAILTSAGEWKARGDADGVLLPQAINLRRQGSYGGALAPPVVVGNNLVYVQGQEGRVRDLKYTENSDAFEGRDLTIFATHLVDGYEIQRLDYAQVPNSIIWAIRQDGILLGLTYLPESDVWAWHKHDTGNGFGYFESLATVPETRPVPPGGATGVKREDSVYVIVRRTINGSTKRYVERFASRRVEDYRLDGLFLDSHLSYNGINVSAVTMTLSTAAGWTTADTITVTASDSTFEAGDVGNGVTIWRNGVAVGVNRILITEYVSATVVKGFPISAVPVLLQNVATDDWSMAVDEVSGLSHLEGEEVTVLANGVVLTATVASGAITLENVFDVIHVGIPITADFETLDLDSEDGSLRPRKKLISQAQLLVERSRGVFAGPNASFLTEYGEATASVLGLDVFESSGASTLNELIEVPLQSTWEKAGRIFVRQSDPYPLNILMVIPEGEVGG